MGNLMTWLHDVHDKLFPALDDRAAAMRDAAISSRQAQRAAHDAVAEWQHERSALAEALARDGPARAIRDAQRRIGEGR